VASDFERLGLKIQLLAEQFNILDKLSEFMNVFLQNLQEF